MTIQDQILRYLRDHGPASRREIAIGCRQQQNSTANTLRKMKAKGKVKIIAYGQGPTPDTYSLGDLK